MSNTDSFIDEVTEEVRRDRLYALMRRYGWIAALAILLLVGGAAWNEWRKAQAQAAAEATGDAILGAMEAESAAARAEALATIEGQPANAPVRGLLRASELVDAGDKAGALAAYDAVAALGDAPEIYRAIAAFKALLLRGPDMERTALRIELEALARPGAPLRLLAEEQLALDEIGAGETEAALSRLNAILADVEVTSGLRRRASQLIVSLGGTPGGETTGTPETD